MSVRLTRDENCKQALTEFLDFHGHCRLSPVENITINKRKNCQTYVAVLLGYVPHDDIRSDFQYSFSEYSLLNNKSYIKIDDIRPIKGNTGMLHFDSYQCHTQCTITVKYFGDYRPYQCERTYEELKGEISLAQSNYDKLYQKHKELFMKFNSEEECPVCYEKLTLEKLSLAICTHATCQKCHDKCDRCPICREKY